MSSPIRERIRTQNPQRTTVYKDDVAYTDCGSWTVLTPQQLAWGTLIANAAYFDTFQEAIQFATAEAVVSGMVGPMSNHQRSASASKTRPKIEAPTQVMMWLDLGYSFRDMRAHVSYQYSVGATPMDRRDALYVAICDKEYAVIGKDDYDIITRHMDY